MKGVRIAVVLAAVAWAGAAAPAGAEELMIELRVELTSLPDEVLYGGVDCDVFAADRRTVVGRGQRDMGLRDGAWSGRVPVLISPAPGRTLGEAKHYACALKLVTPGGERITPSRSASQPWARPKPGTAFTVGGRGDIP
jgi:hypothetical protein